MIKIFVSVRNRLAITKKCIEAIKKHTTLPHSIYVYDNATNYLLDQHIEYFGNLYKEGVISQVTFTSKDSTFNAFSKATTSNMFGCQHETDPEKDKYSFLLMLDNDIILLPKWDLKVKAAWDFVKRQGFKNIKVVGQLPGGIKGDPVVYNITDKMKARVGILGGSGLWAIQPNFFREVGFLDLKYLVNQDKRHDQMYWKLLMKASQNKPYIMGVNHKLGVHCGKLCGSVCNRLTKNRGVSNREDLIKFEDAEASIEKVDFDTFFQSILHDEGLAKDW